MSDLPAMLGQQGTFARDTRFVPRGLETLGGALGRPLAPPPPPPEPELPIDPFEQARAEGFAAGLAHARAEAMSRAQTEAEAQARFEFAFSRLDAELTETLRQRLLDTVVGLCEATLKPLALDRKALAARVEKVAAMFVRADDERVIRLHPDDLELVRPQLPADWEFAPDPALSRGTIRVETRSGGAEDGPESWRRAIAEALDLC